MLALPVRAQKYACVNTEYIMKNVPEYNQALNKVNKYVEEWRKEIEAKQAEVDELRQQYQQESYLLPENLKQRRQDEIRTKDAELRSLQQQRFAPGGDLDQRKMELLKPVQDRVYNAIERVAREKNYAFVFDKAGSPAVLFANKKYDISDDVLQSLGYKPGASPAPDATDEPKKKPTNPEMRQRDDLRPGRDRSDLKPKK
jgi:outer membrane protein